MLAIHLEQQEKVSQLDAKIDEEVNGVKVNVSLLHELVNHLSLTRDAHADELILIRSTLFNISTQFPDIYSRLNSISSSVEERSRELQALHTNVSALTNRVSNTNEFVSTHTQALDQRISQLDFSVQQRFNSISSMNNAIEGRLTHLENTASGAVPMSSDYTILFLIIIVPLYF